MVIKEWGQLQRNSVKTYFINYIAQMGWGGDGGSWNFWLQMRGEQLMQGTMENWSEASHFQRKTN